MGGSTASGDPFLDLAADYSLKWVVTCGDQMGRVFQFDVSDIMQQIRCLDKDAQPRVTTTALAAYQQHTVSNFREGLDEKNLRQIDSLIARPIGVKCGNNQKMTEILGYRGANISHIKRMRHWFAYQGSAVAAVTALQKTTETFPCRPKTATSSNMMLEPYAIVTASEVSVEP